MAERIKVLTVENDKRIAEVIKDILAFEEIETDRVTWVKTADEAIEALKSPEKPSIIILNLVIDSGIEESWQFIRYVRSPTSPFRDVPILVITGMDASDVKMTCKTLGVEGFLAKPFAIEDLLQSVKEVLK